MRCQDLILWPILAGSLLPATAWTQAPPDHAVVVTDNATPPRCRLVLVNLTTGVQRSVGRFACDNLEPTALCIDPVNSDLLLAVDTGQGSGQLLRLERHRPEEFTGVFQIPWGITQRMFLAQSDGTIATPQLGTGGALTVYNTVPKVPPGATSRMRLQRGKALWVLGDAPYLMTMDPLQLSQVFPWTRLNPALRGAAVYAQAAEFRGGRLQTSAGLAMHLY